MRARAGGDLDLVAQDVGNPASCHSESAPCGSRCVCLKKRQTHLSVCLKTCQIWWLTLHVLFSKQRFVSLVPPAISMQLVRSNGCNAWIISRNHQLPSVGSPRESGPALLRYLTVLSSRGEEEEAGKCTRRMSLLARLSALGGFCNKKRD